MSGTIKKRLKKGRVLALLLTVTFLFLLLKYEIIPVLSILDGVSLSISIFFLTYPFIIIVYYTKELKKSKK